MSKVAGYSSPFVGRYLIRNPIANIALHMIDAALFCLPRKRHFNIPRPRRILISNIAHIGDVVMMTALLPVIHEALPDVEIGVIVGSCSKPLLEDHPLVQKVHILDHWKLYGRKGYLKRFKQTLEEVKTQNYDVSVDCCYYFPNTAYLNYRAKIPVRIGYTSGGFGPLFTHPVQFVNRLQTTAEHFAALVSLITRIDYTLLYPNLPKNWNLGDAKAPGLSNCKPENYLVIHMGSGVWFKEWPLEKWRELSHELVKRGHRLVFTGKGEKEAQAVHKVMEGLDHCEDFSNQLSLNECVSLIQRARLVITVDTSMGHIAAATKTPSISIFSGFLPIEHWHPKSDKAKVLIHKDLPCYPCYTKGCSTMPCIRNVTVRQVLQTIEASLDQKKSNDHQ